MQFAGGGTVSEGFQSIDWNYSTNIERLYTLGASSTDCGVPEFAQIRGADVSISFSIYGGITPSISTCAPGVCQNSPCSAVVSIVPGACDITVPPINEVVYFSSYSYNKEKTQFGVESWAGTAYIACDSGSLSEGQFCECEPTYVVLGVAEGTIEGEPNSNQAELETLTGARFRSAATPMPSSRGSVQGGALSIGEYMTVLYGTFQSVGGSVAWNCGISGKASVSMNVRPVY